MKRLDLIIPHERLQDVNKLLHKYKVGGLTLYDVKGRGAGKKEPAAIGRGVMKYTSEFASRTKVEVLVSDSQAKSIVDDILKTISTDSSSDCKIFVYEVAEAYNTESKQTGDTALS